MDWKKYLVLVLVAVCALAWIDLFAWLFDISRELCGIQFLIGLGVAVAGKK